MLSHYVDEATFLPAGARLAGTCFPAHEKASHSPCTHEELGFAIGASRVTVSRLLADFTRRGLVKTGYRSLTVLDQAALELESGG